MEAFEDGEFVRHADYAALLAENERLRKAGDAMADQVWKNCGCEDCEELCDQWCDAKRGEQPNK